MSLGVDKMNKKSKKLEENNKIYLFFMRTKKSQNIPIKNKMKA